jgi:6-phosphogluconolactonase
MRTELGLQAALTDYTEQLRDVEEFDLVMLGMGEDGHTASLFPGHDNLECTEPVIAITNSPKQPAERLTLTYSRLSQTQRMLKILTGSGKQSAVQAWLAGQALPISIPKAKNQTLVYLDQSALGTLQ